MRIMRRRLRIKWEPNIKQNVRRKWNDMRCIDEIRIRQMRRNRLLKYKQFLIKYIIIPTKIGAWVMNV